MARAIDIQTVVEGIQSALGIPSYSEHDKGFDDGLEYVLDLIEKAPTLTPQNERLAIEELREMDGEPVWIKRLKGLSVCDTGWAVVDVCPNQIRVWWFGSEVGDEPSEKDYGETWIAYRRPPEGEEDT